MIRFAEGSDFFELGLMKELTDPAGEDAYLTVVANSSGFVGHNDLWVSGAHVAQFCRELAQLNATRQGSATLEGFAPEDLKLKIRSIDSAGHMMIEGSTGYWANHRVAVWHAVHFGFDFEPGQLETAVQVPWVTALAGRPADESA